MEFPTYYDALTAMEMHPKGILKGRIVTTQWSSQAELFNLLFPNQTVFPKKNLPGANQAQRIASPLPNQRVLSDGGAQAQAQKTGIFLQREEINAILVICRNYKLHFSRKCAERPFENIISVITKIPWNNYELISPTHRDHLFEMIKLGLDSLRIHLGKSDVSMDETLFVRMLRAGLCVPLFTERQKITLLNVAGISCPPDLAQFIYMPSSGQCQEVPAPKSPQAPAQPVRPFPKFLSKTAPGHSSTPKVNMQRVAARYPQHFDVLLPTSMSECRTCSESALPYRSAGSTCGAGVSYEKPPVRQEQKDPYYGIKKYFYQPEVDTPDDYNKPPVRTGGMSPYAPVVSAPDCTQAPSSAFDASTSPPQCGTQDKSQNLRLQTHALLSGIHVLGQKLQKSRDCCDELLQRAEMAENSLAVDRQSYTGVIASLEQRCKELESILSITERSNVQLELRLRKIQEIILRNAEKLNIPGDMRAEIEHQALSGPWGGFLGGSSILSEGVKGLWDR